ncbi:glycoside hydrolase family 2 TIM barrel-domain containing protein [Marinoscillum sp.]|uniref:glycoside hydrolase family 2 TIM barrel-domain containing protein n=1 Tax=Marinoscillum sp. TaxID=2024838 RepID=UPI003BA84CDF
MKIFIPMILILLVVACTPAKKENANTEKPFAREVWSKQQANSWYKDKPWYRGANFNPSSAINQLETWQAESFDAKIIDRELGWAEDIGMNAMRVYLHHVAWEQDKEGFKNRMAEYLKIADSHGIATMFVFFDDCWNNTYQAGRQPEPKTGTHNSGWIQDPGQLIYDQPELVNDLEVYVKDVMKHFADDSRILLWDVYNEPGNSGYGDRSLPLLKKVFQWGREVNPSQPLSAGVWNNSLTNLNKFQLENSDVITYHNYEDSAHHAAMIDTLQQYGKPMLCTEYMARTRNSTFQDIMPMLKAHKIGAFNWGLVSGKSNTIYAWDTPIESGEEPEVWFHDIFRQDGSVYSQEEVDLIKELTSAD